MRWTDRFIRTENGNKKETDRFFARAGFMRGRIRREGLCQRGVRPDPVEKRSGAPAHEDGGRRVRNADGRGRIYVGSLRAVRVNACAEMLRQKSKHAAACFFLRLDKRLLFRYNKTVH